MKSALFRIAIQIAAALSLAEGLSSASRRDALRSMVAPALVCAVSAASPPPPAVAAEETTPSKRVKFQRYPQLRFIAALGEPTASSGVGADKWGLWSVDPGPRGVFLRDFDRKLSSTGGKAPAGWVLDRDQVWVEEHGLVMPSPGDLPRKSTNKSTKEILPFKRYLVTGARKVTTSLTLYDDGRWELGEGSLYDVTHLPCRSAKYTPAAGLQSGALVAVRCTG